MIIKFVFLFAILLSIISIFCILYYLGYIIKSLINKQPLDTFDKIFLSITIFIFLTKLIY